MGQDQVSGGDSVLCWLAAPVAIFNGNLQKYGNKVKIGNNCPICVEFEWNSEKIIHGVWYHYHEILISKIPETIPVLLYSFSLRFCSTMWYKMLEWELELKGVASVGDCGLVNGYFIFIECYISEIKSLGYSGLWHWARKYVVTWPG